jgi:hypothetical protein
VKVLENGLICAPRRVAVGEEAVHFFVEASVSEIGGYVMEKTRHF